jgi:putative ATP-binding cassette transporter
VPQLAIMARAPLASPVRNTLFVLAFALFLVIAIGAYGQIRLNRWNQPFYDALSKHQLKPFVIQLGVFAVIAGALLVLNVVQKWLGEMSKLKLREGLFDDLIENWMRPRRGFRLAHAGPIGVNPDQRIHEDSRHRTELSAELGMGLLQASILFASFVRVLWALSREFAFHMAGHTVSIPGYMVWAAILYAASASLLSYWVGRGLVERNADRYAREADLRFSLVRVNEHIDAISLVGGEADEARRLRLELANVLAAMRSLVGGLTNLTWVTAGFGWITLVAPILISAPMYFAGNLSFGGLMMAAAAFTQAQSSLRWFVDNFSTLADWRATLLRVASFRQAAVNAEKLRRAENRITFEDGEPGKLTIDHLEIASPGGRIRLEEREVQMKAGEHILILGDAEAGKTVLFRALAGLWPWGAGTVTRSKTEEVLCMPHTPYLPPGTLREVLAYPLEVARFKDTAFTHALSRLGLEHLSPMLDVPRRWDHELGEGAQQSLALARCVLHAAPWILIDDIFASLDERTLNGILEIFSQDLKSTALIHIGRSPAQEPFFSQVLHLVKDPATRRLPRHNLSNVGQEAAEAVY